VKYRLKIESRAKKDIEALDSVAQKRIVKKLKFFLEQDDPLHFAKKLVDPIDGSYRFRIGHFRVVFDVKGEVIKLLKVQHRKDVYKK